MGRREYSYSPIKPTNGMVMAVKLELRWSEGNLDSLYVIACKSARCSCLGPNSEKVKRDHRLVMNSPTAVWLADSGQLDTQQFSDRGPVSWIPSPGNPLTAALRWLWYHIYKRTNTHCTCTTMHVGVTVCKWVPTAIWYTLWWLLVPNMWLCMYYELRF